MFFCSSIVCLTFQRMKIPSAILATICINIDDHMTMAVTDVIWRKYSPRRGVLVTQSEDVSMPHRVTHTAINRSKHPAKHLIVFTEWYVCILPKKKHGTFHFCLLGSSVNPRNSFISSWRHMSQSPTPNSLSPLAIAALPHRTFT